MLTPGDLVLLNRVIRGTGTAVTVCLPPFETCEHGTKDRKEYIESTHARRAAYDSWDALVMHGFGAARSANLTVFNRTKNPHQPFPDAPTYSCLPPDVIGSPSATVLVVGERPNGDLDLPFFSITGCSPFLNKSLEAAGFSEDELAFVNAFANDGTTRERDLYRVIRGMTHLQSIIVLGLDAFRAVSSQWMNTTFGRTSPIKVFTQRHPAYWRRFHAADPVGYVAQLKEVRRATVA